MPTIISFRDAEFAVGRITDRLDKLEFWRKGLNLNIDTSKFVSASEVQNILKQFLNSFVTNIGIELDSIPEGTGISHYKLHTFKNDVIITGDLVVDNIYPETTETFDLGSPTFRWRDLYVQGIQVKGNITAIDANREIGDNSNPFNAFLDEVAVSTGVELTYATGNRAAIIDTSKNLVSGLINLGAPGVHVQGSVGIANGGTNATTEADARTNLDVYSKAEVDSAIAAAIAAIVVDAIGDHDHGGAVPADGGHSHTLS